MKGVCVVTVRWVVKEKRRIERRITKERKDAVWLSCFEK